MGRALSDPLQWSVEVLDSKGVPVRRFTGMSDHIDRKWFGGGEGRFAGPGRHLHGSDRCLERRGQHGPARRLHPPGPLTA